MQCVTLQQCGLVCSTYQSLDRCIRGWRYSCSLSGLSSATNACRCLARGTCRAYTMYGSYFTSSTIVLLLTLIDVEKQQATTGLLIGIKPQQDPLECRDEDCYSEAGKDMHFWQQHKWANSTRTRHASHTTKGATCMCGICHVLSRSIHEQHAEAAVSSCAVFLCCTKHMTSIVRAAC